MLTRQNSRNLLKSLVPALALTTMMALPLGVQAQEAAKASLMKSCVALVQSKLKTRGHRIKLQEVTAQNLAALIAVDSRTAKLVSDPRIARYLIFTHFLKDSKTPEIADALQAIASSEDFKDLNLYDFINEEIGSRLSDPAVASQVNEVVAHWEKSGGRPTTESLPERLKKPLMRMVSFAKSIKDLRAFYDRELSIPKLDTYLFQVHGSVRLKLPESQVRPWEVTKGGYASIHPSQIHGIPAHNWARLAYFAEETEAPILGYSLDTGERLRAFFPSMSIFSGKIVEVHERDKALFQKLIEKGEPLPHPCGGTTWCFEENRHAVVNQMAGDRITGIQNKREMTFEAPKMGDYTDVESGLVHLAGRNSSEWSANVGYPVMLVHSSGATYDWINKVRTDETKHLTIFSAAWVYYYGRQLNLRTKMLLMKMRELFKEQTTGSSTAGDENILVSNPSQLMAIMIGHVMVEGKMRTYLKSLPFKTMKKLFDDPVDMTDLDDASTPPEKMAKIRQIRETEKKNRAEMTRWTPQERAQYQALAKVEKQYGGLITSLVHELFQTFRGAETAGSRASLAVINQINKLNTGLPEEVNEYVKESLRELLRDYQIMNNDFVRVRRDVMVRYRNALEGFEVVLRHPTETDVIEARALTSNHHRIRVNKPQNIQLKVGVPLKVTLNTASGVESRVFSLASSPQENYIEFSVTNSNSAFKQALLQLKAGDWIRVETSGEGLQFDNTKPAVFLATGIGITPFMSYLQSQVPHAAALPIQLIFGNSTLIPYQAELQSLAQRLPQLDIDFRLTKPEAGWTGSVGRVDQTVLSNVMKSAGPNAVFYIVGNPAMVESTHDNLIHLGVPKERIKVEYFMDANPAAMNVELSTIANGDKAQAKEKRICMCHSVTTGQIESLVSQNPNISLDEVTRVTKAATGCGSCKGNVITVMKRASGQ